MPGAEPEPAEGVAPPGGTVDAGTLDASFDYSGLDDVHEHVHEPIPTDADSIDADETILIDGRALGGQFRGAPVDRLAPPTAGSAPVGQPVAQPSDPARPQPAAGPPRLGWGRRRAPGPHRHAPHARAHRGRAPDPGPGPAPGELAAAPVGAAAPPGPAPSAGEAASFGLPALAKALRGPRRRATRVLIGVLCGLLGFFAVVQVRLQQANDGTLRNARQEDLIRILDDLNNHSDQLSEEIRNLEDRRAQLQSGSSAARAALAEAQKRKAVLGILSGTVPAHGPGITLKITDPTKKVDAAILLDTLEELRDAGAEAIQINGVRVVADTAFLDAGAGRISIDGHVLAAPYLFVVIGEPDTLGPALRIPGGVFNTLETAGATPTLASAPDVEVDALRPAATAAYAKPAAG